MPVSVANRRQDSRNHIPDFLGAEIEFNVPDGALCRVQLLDLSTEGGSFSIPERVHGLRPGVSLTGASIYIGEITIVVHLQIQHVTRSVGKSYKCGVRLYPQTDDDRNELIAVVSRLESLPK